MELKTIKISELPEQIKDNDYPPKEGEIISLDRKPEDMRHYAIQQLFTTGQVIIIKD